MACNSPQLDADNYIEQRWKGWLKESSSIKDPSILNTRLERIYSTAINELNTLALSKKALSQSLNMLACKILMERFTQEVSDELTPSSPESFSFALRWRAPYQRLVYDGESRLTDWERNNLRYVKDNLQDRDLLVMAKVLLDVDRVRGVTYNINESLIAAYKTLRLQDSFIEINWNRRFKDASEIFDEVEKGSEADYPDLLQKIEDTYKLFQKWEQQLQKRKQQIENFEGVCFRKVGPRSPECNEESTRYRKLFQCFNPTPVKSVATEWIPEQHLKRPSQPKVKLSKAKKRHKTKTPHAPIKADKKPQDKAPTAPKQVNFPYKWDPRVSYWFSDDAKLAATESPFKWWERAVHSFPAEIDQYILSGYAKETVHINTLTGHKDRLFVLPGRLESCGRSETGVYTICIGEDGLVYHRCFHSRGHKELFALVDKEIKLAEFPEIKVSEETRSIRKVLSETCESSYDPYTEEMVFSGGGVKATLFKVLWNQ